MEVARADFAEDGGGDVPDACTGWVGAGCFVVLGRDGEVVSCAFDEEGGIFLMDLFGGEEDPCAWALVLSESRMSGFPDAGDADGEHPAHF